MHSFTFISECEADTDRLGAALAAALAPGTVICLNGPLGAGKTRFVQGVARALGCTNQFVTSPTFTLVQEYDARLPICHLDAYRLKDSDEFLELGGDEILAGQGAVFIEWAERIADVFPPEALTIDITVIGETRRRFDLRGGEPAGDDLLRRVSARLPSDRTAG